MNGHKRVDLQFKSLGRDIHKSLLLNEKASQVSGPTAVTRANQSSKFVPSGNLASLLEPKTYFGKSGRFSSLHIGKMWTDNTITNATRKQQMEDSKIERELKKMEKRRTNYTEWHSRMEREILIKQRALNRKKRRLEKIKQQQNVNLSATPFKMKKKSMVQESNQITNRRARDGILLCEETEQHDASIGTNSTPKISNNEDGYTGMSMFITQTQLHRPETDFKSSSKSNYTNKARKIIPIRGKASSPSPTRSGVVSVADPMESNSSKCIIKRRETTINGNTKDAVTTTTDSIPSSSRNAIPDKYIRTSYSLEIEREKMRIKNLEFENARIMMNLKKL